MLWILLAAVFGAITPVIAQKAANQSPPVCTPSPIPSPSAAPKAP